MGKRSSRKEAAELTLALANAGKDGAFIVRQYAIAKNGDDSLMEIEGDRMDLVADIIADLHHVDQPISALAGFASLETALHSYCADEGFSYESLKGRGERNGYDETYSPAPGM